MKIAILSSRPIGERCKKWAEERGYELCDIKNADIIFSVLFRELVKIKKGKKYYNFHLGILPEYRGSGTVNWVIINEEKEVGVTLHEMNEKIDDGNILTIKKIPTFQKDTAETLMKRMENVIFSTFVRWVPKIIKGNFKTIPQDKTKVKTYYRKDLERAKDLTKFARAFTFEDKEKCYYYTRSGKKIYLNYEAS
jgi:methionyl-tRNA formyltransferase